MAGNTQSTAETQLALYIAAETAVLTNQSYSINGRSLTRANLKDIRDGIVYWDSQVKTFAAGGRRSRLVTPI